MSMPDTGGGNAPSWLFSFVDLAFLLLIAMTQLAEDNVPTPVELGAIEVPRIDEEASESLPAFAGERWQVRIHAPERGAAPFELVRVGRAEPGPRVELDALEQQLAEIEGGGARKPLLAPHEDSRSQDLLDAVAALEEQWPGSRRATVAPRLARR